MMNFNDDTSSSVVVNYCQVCEHPNLDSIFFLGYLPPVNRVSAVGDRPREQRSYPAQLLQCPKCKLVQLGLIVDPKILFPSEYPYTSSTTKVLRDNFSELYLECRTLVKLGKNDLIVDIGSNDGNLLNNFRDTHRVVGITPEEIGRLAIERGIPTILDYFCERSVTNLLKDHGTARVVTATNVFAHIEHINDVLDLILKILQPNGVFISESHYLLPLIETLQYDTIYHEHLRYYSLHSLQYLLDRHGLEVFHAKRIHTHGGSLRVYAARRGEYPVMESVNELLAEEAPTILNKQSLIDFGERVVHSKLALLAMIFDIKRHAGRIYGIGAPSRAGTLINYVGLDERMLDYVVEVEGSHKIGKYVPGTLIPIVAETCLFTDQPEYALLFSWHIMDELIPKLRKKGFKGKFICPLPEPRIIE